MAIQVESLTVGIGIVGARAATKALSIVTRGLEDSVKAARDAAETIDKFNTVFRDMAVTSKRAGDEIAKSFGVTSTASRKMLGDVGDILTGFGFTQEAALDLADEVTRLGIDLASFTNFSGGAEGATAALTKAMLGEAESVKALGIVIRQDTSEYKNMIATIMESEGVTLTQAKALAALRIATEQSANAVGDYARTFDSAMNVQRRYENSLEDLGIAVGTAVNEHLTPLKEILTDIFNEYTETIRVANEWREANKRAAEGTATLYDEVAILEGKMQSARIAIEGGFVDPRQLAASMRYWEQKISELKIAISLQEDEAIAREKAAKAAETAGIVELKMLSNLQASYDDYYQAVMMFNFEAAEVRRAVNEAAEREELASIARIKAARVAAANAMYGQLRDIVQTYYNNEIQAAGDNEEELAKIREKQFKANQAFGIADTIINTATAIMKVLAQGGIFAIPIAAAMGALGAAQIAMIASAKPSFADGTPPGGYTVPAGYNDDSFPVSAKSGETVNISRAGEGGGGTQIVIMLDSQVLADVTTDLIANRKIVIRQGDLVA